MSAENAVPGPSVDRIDYARPQDYRTLSPSFGDTKQIQGVAATLKADTPERTLAAIGGWIQTNLRYDDRAAYAWRNFDTVLDTRVLGGCADQALVFAALARACGIPAVFVKTMDVDWIREFRATGACTIWRGHVFLEVYLQERWRLLDAAALQLYEEYDPAMRLLPGNRYAYDKGADPYKLLLSLDWERWKQQTAAYFRKFDLARLPVGEGRDVASSPDDVYVAANSPVYQAVVERCRALGHMVRMSFNVDFNQWLAKARGSYLIITCVLDEVVLPETYHGRYLPIPIEELRRKVRADGQGVVRKQACDGTRIVLLYGKDVAALLDVAGRFELSPRL
jgi:hypothetical protein